MKWLVAESMRAGAMGLSSALEYAPAPYATTDELIALAREAAKAGGGHPAVLNAANEEAVNAFLAGGIAFSGIVWAVERAMAAFAGSRDSLQEILEADRWAREYVKVNSGRLRT